MTPARFPHSDTPGSTLGCQLPRAYRRLLRPSSALDAKASTMCPSQLVTHTTNPTPPKTRVASDSQCTLTHNSHTQLTHNSHMSSCARACDSPQKNQHTPHTISRACVIKQKETHPQPPPTQRGRRVHLQMLASTIQISNNNPTPAPTPPQGMPTRAEETPHRPHAGTRHQY